MSVDRNYAVRISANREDLTTQSDGYKSDNFDPTSAHEPHRIVAGLNDIVSSAVFLLRGISAPEKDRNFSPQKSEATTSFSRATEGGIEAGFSTQPAASATGHLPGLQNPNWSFTAVGSPVDVPPRSNLSESATNDRTLLLNQVKQLQASFQTQVPATNPQDVADMLSAVRRIREAFLEQQKNNVTREELNRELQTLRLVMEGRK